MIPIKRPEEPDIFRTFESQREELRSFYRLSQNERAQRRFTFYPISENSKVREALYSLFNGKCAYCESKVTKSNMHIDHFRPIHSAQNLNGEVSSDYYGWLAYEWENLYLVCPQCNIGKSNRFPVSGDRASLGSDFRSLREEKALLLDPCKDNPGHYLVFNEEGRVASQTEKGRITIKILNLNRTELVDARKRAIFYLTSLLKKQERLLDELLHSDISDNRYRQNHIESENIKNEILTLCDRSQPYSEALNQVALQWQTNVSKDIDLFTLELFEKEEERRKRFFLSSKTIEKAETKEQYFITKRYINKIKIKNFNGIGDLSFDINLAGKTSTPWLMLLGENGVGKSSVLKAIALTLMATGERNRLIKALNLEPKDFIKNERASSTIEIYLSDSNDPISLNIFRYQNKFYSESPGAKILVLGYGSTRLLPKKGSKSTNKPNIFQPVAVRNLFNPFHPMVDATDWLLHLNEEDFNNIAIGIKDLLLLPEETILSKKALTGEIIVSINDTVIPLNRLSDGYQTTLALAVDIMSVVKPLWSKMELAEGIVLLDEIGSHLHPRWQMQIVKRLRRVFPNLQFISTTHEPLCLKGLNRDEVVVMKFGKHNEVIGITGDLPDPNGLSAEQLLKSEHFGLNSTLDPEIEDLFDEYYRILSLGDPNGKDKARYLELIEQLKDKQQLGRTRREQLLLEAADEEVAEISVEPIIANRREIRESARRKISYIWSNTRIGGIEENDSH